MYFHMLASSPSSVAEVCFNDIPPIPPIFTIRGAAPSPPRSAGQEDLNPVYAQSVDSYLIKPRPSSLSPSALKGGSPINVVVDYRPDTAGSCGHSNAGQELCYLCHQRARRNVPVSFTEERRQREREEDKLLQQYQNMKDTENTLNEQVALEKFITFISSVCML